MTVVRWFFDVRHKENGVAQSQGRSASPALGAMTLSQRERESLRRVVQSEAIFNNHVSRDPSLTDGLCSREARECCRIGWLTSPRALQTSGSGSTRTRQQVMYTTLHCLPLALSLLSVRLLHLHLGLPFPMPSRHANRFCTHSLSALQRVGPRIVPVPSRANASMLTLSDTWWKVDCAKSPCTRHVWSNFHASQQQKMYQSRLCSWFLWFCSCFCGSPRGMSGSAGEFVFLLVVLVVLLVVVANLK